MSDAVLLTRAALAAAEAHKGQTRKGGEVPYVNHVIEVAHLVAEAGGTPEMVAAALLHDVVEDGEATGETVAADFGPCIATLVAGLTDAPEWKALPREARKRRQAEHMARAPRAVRRIKIADQTSNVRDVGRLPKGWSPGEARAYIAGAALVVDACRGADAGLEAAFDAARAQALATLDAIDKGGQ
jgi:guanosine-3',5'-bis(diphosphate) 3'-pyrophosphohydrolase